MEQPTLSATCNPEPLASWHFLVVVERDCIILFHQTLLEIPQNWTDSRDQDSNLVRRRPKDDECRKRRGKTSLGVVMQRHMQLFPTAFDPIGGCKRGPVGGYRICCTNNGPKGRHAACSFDPFQSRKGFSNEGRWGKIWRLVKYQAPIVSSVMRRMAL